MAIELTSASKKRQSLQDTASAVTVLSRDTILNSGATSIPEALRLVPGLQVAQIDAHKHAISSRGFNSQFSNKLLVLIDGRSVYVPSYSGVYWDSQDVLLEDIDRIEVIRGSGAAVWGANAVNGVINIITRSSAKTTGVHLSAHAGKEQKLTVNMRYGATLGEGLTGRVYLKYKDVDSSFSTTLMSDAGDQWDSLRGGFRLDYSDDSNELTLQGDIYQSDMHQILGGLWTDPMAPGAQPPFFDANIIATAEAKGSNLIAKWQQKISEQQWFSIQAYFDHTHRDEIYFGQHNDTLDIELNHQLRFDSGSELLWGLNYRRIKDDFENTFQFQLLPESQTTDLYSIFAQYEMNVAEHTRLTLGAKLEDNVYTGTEFQPNIRLICNADENHSFWGAIARAVRTPSRIEDSGRVVNGVLPLPVPMPIYVFGHTEVKSEEQLSYEIGYRVQASETLFYDISAFYNDYDNLVSLETTGFISLGETSIPGEVMFGNLIDAHSYGLEATMTWWLQEWWKLQSNYTYLNVSASAEQQRNDSFSARSTKEVRHNISYHCTLISNIGDDWTLNLTAMYVDELENTSLTTTTGQIDHYFNLNLGLRRQLPNNLEIAAFIQNVLDDKRLEFVAENYSIPTEIERSAFIRVRKSF